MASNKIIIKGAKEHNLKNIDLEIKEKYINSEIEVHYNISRTSNFRNTPSLSINNYSLPSCMRTLDMAIRD